MRFFFVLLICFLPVLTLAQSITISGLVKDKETSEPLVYASITIKGKPVGTISNLQGEFDFHFSSDYRNEILVVSMIGYSNFEAPVWSILTDSVQTILLPKSYTLLNEVVVKDSLSGGDILSKALARIDENYPMKPFMLDAFYRDIKKIGGTYISLLEAAVKIYDENYAEPRNKYKLRERVGLVELRKSLGYESKFTSFFDQDNLLEDLLLNNNIRYRQIEAKDEMYSMMVREEDSYYNNHEIYVVTHKESYFLKIFIDKEDFSIVHLEYETGPAEDYIGKRKNLISKFAGLKKIIDFKRYNGKMYLNYINMTSKVNWYDAETKELKFEAELLQQLLVNQVQPNTTERIGSTESMRNYGLQYQDFSYNKKFWEGYNFIKDSPLDKQILSDLEKHAPLENQFEEN